MPLNQIVKELFFELTLIVQVQIDFILIDNEKLIY